MRKLKLQMNTSIDALVSTGPNDDQKWITWAFDEIEPQVLELLDSSDTNIIGRKMAYGYIPYWQNVVKDPGHQMYQIGVRIVNINKIVFSNSMEKSLWENTQVVSGDLASEITKLKNLPGKDIIVYGGSSFVSSLIREGLIDEFHFFVNPVALGKGLPIFDQLDHFMKLKLERSVVYKSGIVLLSYSQVD